MNTAPEATKGTVPPSEASSSHGAAATTPENATLPGRVPRFSIGELLPFKGVWFVVKEVTKTGLLLEAKAFTAKGLNR